MLRKRDEELSVYRKQLIKLFFFFLKIEIELNFEERYMHWRKLHSNIQRHYMWVRERLTHKVGIFLAGDGRLRHTSAFKKGSHAVCNGTLSTSVRVGPQAWKGAVLGGAVHIIAKAFGARLRQSNGLYYAIGRAINCSPAALSAFLEGAMKGSVGLLENSQVVGVIASPLRPKRTVKNV